MKISPIKFNTSKIVFQKRLSFHFFKPKAQLQKDEVCLSKEKKEEAKPKAIDESLIEKRTQELRQKNIPVYHILNLVTLNERDYQKALYLINKRTQIRTSIELAQLEDKKFIQALKLLSCGINPVRVYDCMQDEKLLEKVNLLLSLGADLSSDERMLFLAQDKFSEVISLVQKGNSFSDSIDIVKNSWIKNEYEKNLKSGFDEQTASILAVLFYELPLDSKSKPDIAQIIEIIKKQTKDTNELSKHLGNFLEKETKNENFNLKDFATYLQLFNFKHLKTIAPKTKSYCAKELLTFLGYHFKDYNLCLTPDSLGQNFDLTNYLKNNHALGYELDEILISYPLLRREVGNIPFDWLNRIENKKSATKKIYKAIQRFQNSKNTDSFSKELAEILSKKVNVEYISKGAYGSTYKIEIEEATPACIKLFHINDAGFHDLRNGGHYEIQTALFLNEQSNDFVKMYFGKVAGEKNKDAFLVTQFLSDTIKPQKYPLTAQKYKIRYFDDKPQNSINGKIVDFGGVYINKI